MGFKYHQQITSAITPVGLSVLDFDDSMNAKFLRNTKRYKTLQHSINRRRITSINNNINYIQ